MDVNNVDKNVHKTQVKLIVETPNKNTVEDYYNMIIYNTIDISDIIKISCMCANNEDNSYNCSLDRKSFTELKIAQDLIINFEEFGFQLKMLFIDVSQDSIKLKLKLGQKITLSFFTTSHLKILTILDIPLQITSAEETIKFLKEKITDLTAENEKYEIYLAEMHVRNKDLEEENRNLFALEESSNKQQDEEKFFYNETLAMELQFVKETHNKCLTDKLSLMNQIEAYRCINNVQSDALLDITADVDTLKEGIDYYLEKIDHSQGILVQQDCALRHSVPLEKYESLYQRFSKAIADLVKCQVHLKKLVSVHDFKKVQNSALKEELDKCIRTIKSLETEHKKRKANDLEVARAGIMIDIRDLPELRTEDVADLIEKLTLQNEIVSQGNRTLKKKVNEKNKKQKR